MISMTFYWDFTILSDFKMVSDTLCRFLIWECRSLRMIWRCQVKSFMESDDCPLNITILADFVLRASRQTQVWYDMRTCLLDYPCCESNTIHNSTTQQYQSLNQNIFRSLWIATICPKYFRFPTGSIDAWTRFLDNSLKAELGPVQHEVFRGIWY